MNRKELDLLVSKYKMEPLLNNDVEQIQIGYHCVSPDPIPELDILEKEQRKDDLVKCFMIGSDLGGVSYRIYAPSGWF